MMYNVQINLINILWLNREVACCFHCHIGIGWCIRPETLFFFKLNNFRGLSENMSENQVLKLTAETKASIVCPSSGLVLEGEWSDEIWEKWT